MAAYRALVLASGQGHGLHHVFLVRTSESEAKSNLLKDAEVFAHEKYNQELKSVDLEVVTPEELKKRIRSLNTKGR